MQEQPLIFYASIGHGHKHAAFALYKEFMKRGFRPKMIDTFYELSPTLHYSLLKSYLTLLKLSPSLWRKAYVLSEKYPLFHMTDRLCSLFIRRLYEMVEKERPPFVISTNAFVTPLLAAVKMKKRSEMALYSVITDFNMHPAYVRNGVNLYFTQDPNCHEFAEKYRLPKELFIATGIPIATSSFLSYSKKKLRYELNLPQKEKVVLLAGGGFGLANYVMIVKQLEKMQEKLVILCMTGQNKKAFMHLSLMKSKHELRVISFTHKFLQYLRASDVVISKAGGLTMAESLICETPILIFQPVPGHEEHNAQFLEKNGAAICIKDKNDLLFHTTQVLFNHDVQRQMKESARRLQKPYAAKHIVDRILQCEHQHGHAFPC